MKKNIKKNNVNANAYHRAGLRTPEIVNSDDLLYISEDDLMRRHDFLVSEKDMAVRHDIDPKPWEVEICYVQRESQIRSTRRAAHERFLKMNPDAAAFREVELDRNEVVN